MEKREQKTAASQNEDAQVARNGNARATQGGSAQATRTEAEDSAEEDSAEASRTEEADSGDEEADAEREIVVRGSRRPPEESALAPGVSTSIIRKERLHVAGGSLPDALREAPGVQVTQSGGLGSPATARVRGATAAQTPVYLDNIRINDEVGGVADLSTVPAYFIDRVEIYRSHTPEQLNQFGVGGAIALFPRRIQKTESALDVEVGSFGTRALRGRFGYVEGDRRLLVALQADHADNDYPYFDSRGTLFVDEDGGPARLQNADSQSQSIWLSAQDRLGKARLNLLAHYSHREQGAPKLALVPTESARAEFSRALVAITSKIPFDAATLSLSTRAIWGSTTLDDPQLELGQLTPYTRTPGQRVEEVIESRQYPFEGLVLAEQLSASVERLQRFERKGGSTQEMLAALRLSTRPSFSADYHLSEELSFGGLVALNCISTGTSEVAFCDEPNVSGRVGARYASDNFSIYANLGRYQRLATLSELYGVSLLVQGNEDLKSETGLSPEVGARSTWTGKKGNRLLWVDVAAFARFSQDLIVYVRSAQGYLSPQNRDRSRTIGGEIALGSEPFPGLRLEGNLSLLDPRDTSESRRTTNDILPFISRATANFLAGYHHEFHADGALTSAGASFHLTHQSSRYADPAGLGVIPAQTFGDVVVESTLLAGHLKTQFRISNVWNAKRFDVVGFPLPPRSYFFNTEVIY